MESLGINLHVLRALSLSQHGINRLPASIGRLIHLRYIDLSDTALETLPDSICDLLDLHTLKLINCTSLTSLPQRICNLVNLRHLDIRGSGVREMPLEMHKLRSLRMLADFIVSENGAGLGELAGLYNLKKLTISELQNVAFAKDASYAELKEKNRLDDLTLQWGNDNDSKGNEMEVLEYLEPHRDLRRLTVEHYGGARFPNWLGDPSYWCLQSVALRHFGNCYSLPALGLLPFLKYLLIEGFAKVSSVGFEFYGVMSASQKPFQSLEVLHFQNMLEWKEWNILEGIEFPRLRWLHIMCCPKLVRGLPKQLLSLKKLEIIGCNDLVVPLPEVSDTCEVFVHGCDELRKGHRVATSEADQITVESYSDVPSTSSEFDSDDELRKGHRVATSEADQITVESYSDVPSTSSEFDSDDELREGHRVATSEADQITVEYYSDFSSSSKFDSDDEIRKGHRVATSEADQITVESYSDFTSTSSEFDSDVGVIVPETRMETESTGSRLPVDSSSSDATSIPKLKETSGMLGHQVESDIHNIKQQTDPQSSMAEANIPITTQVPVLPITGTPTTTDPVQEETLSKEDVDDQRSSFEVLKVSTMSQLKSLPPKLHSLKIEGCQSLEDLPDDLLGRITTLKELYLISCSSLRSPPYSGSLTTLYMSNCRRLEFLPSLESREKLSFLRHLFIGSSGDFLTTLPLNLFSQLKTLCIWDCPNLLSFDVVGEPRGHLASLESLEIRDCPRLESFPDEGLHTPILASILLSNCKNLNKLPNAKNFLTSLNSLFLHRCPQIESFPSGGLPSSLVFLSIAYCDKLTPQKEWGLYSLESLDHFELEGGCIGMESFPEENFLPCNITSLHISTLKSLKKLDYKGFQHLNALQKLEIHCCKMLRSLPDQGLPSSLNHLCVQECPLLTPRLTEDEWHKVAYIPHVQIDHQVLS